MSSQNPLNYESTTLIENNVQSAQFGSWSTSKRTSKPSCTVTSWREIRDLYVLQLLEICRCRASEHKLEPIVSHPVLDLPLGKVSRCWTFNSAQHCLHNCIFLTSNRLIIQIKTKSKQLDLHLFSIGTLCWSGMNSAWLHSIAIRLKDAQVGESFG